MVYSATQGEAVKMVQVLGLGLSCFFGGFPRGSVNWTGLGLHINFHLEFWNKFISICTFCVNFNLPQFEK